MLPQSNENIQLEAFRAAGPLSANGAAPYQPGASLQEACVPVFKALKARFKSHGTW